MPEKNKSKLYNLDPVLVEYHSQGDFWTIHREEEASSDRKRSGQLVPYGTAIQLENVRRCTGCFDMSDSYRH